MSLAALLDLDAARASFEADRRHVAILRQHIDDYSRRLISCAMILLEAWEGEEFIIGDTPVIPAALGFGKAKAICPISRERALIMIYGWNAVTRRGPSRASLWQKTAVFQSLGDHLGPPEQGALAPGRERSMAYQLADFKA